MQIYDIENFAISQKSVCMFVSAENRWNAQLIHGLLYKVDYYTEGYFHEFFKSWMFAFKISRIHTFLP